MHETMLKIKFYCIPALLIFFLYSPVTLEAAGSRWFTTEKGLKIRETPSVSGKEITLIPHNSEVEFFEELNPEITIAGTKGKWTKISWKGRQGWAFGGFLSSAPPDSAAGEVKDGEWWQLTKVKGKDVIYRPCNGETRSIRLDGAGKSLQLFLGSGETMELEILKIIRNSNGSISFDIRSESDGETYTIRMQDTAGGKVTTWENLPMMGGEDRFVESRFLSGYKTVEEKCDYDE